MAFLYQVLGLFQSLVFIIVGMFGIGFLIGFHELGHFIMCKLFKVRTPSFSIGMGPRLIRKKIGETEFVLSAIPLGGYVEIAGEAEVGQGDQHEAQRADKFSFATKPYYQKMLIIAGGILFNIMFSYIILSALYYTGMPKSPLLYPGKASTIISFVEPQSPAQQANLNVDDKIIAIDGIPASTAENLIKQIQASPNKSTRFLIERSGQEQEIVVVVGEKTVQNKSMGYIGIDLLIPRYPLFTSIKYGIESTHSLIGQIGSAFKNIFVKRSIENLGGPLMVISQTIKGAEKGLKIFLLLLAFISVNLAVLNIIPLPIMDGGQALFSTIEALIRRPLPDKVKMYIHYACWIGILILAVLLSIQDILRMFILR